MQDAHSKPNDHVHGRNYSDDAGKPGAGKARTPGLEGGIRKRAAMYLAGCLPYFPSLTLPRAKFTLRLHEALREMGFELGAEAGARLGKKLSYPGSPDTILRLVKGAELPAASSPRVVGLDD